MIQIELTNQTVFLTGAKGGIGSAVYDCFKSCGANIISPSSKELNLLSEIELHDYLNSIDAEPDIIIHSAGINKLSGIEEISSEDLKEVFQVNLFSFITILKHFIPKMREKRYGRIVGISSLYGIISKERRIPYSSSKHAMSGLIKSIALETAKDNILINGVAPGYIMTNMTRKNLSEIEIEDLKKQIPTGRFQDASEIANICLFLCSSLNQSITGQIIPVDGGFLCK